MNEKQMWLAFGLVILVVLVVTTPGWKEVLGLDISFNLGQYVPLLIVLGFMGILLAVVLSGGNKNNDEK